MRQTVHLKPLKIFDENNFDFLQKALSELKGAVLISVDAASQQVILQVNARALPFSKLSAVVETYDYVVKEITPVPFIDSILCSILSWFKPMGTAILNSFSYIKTIYSTKTISLITRLIIAIILWFFLLSGVILHSLGVQCALSAFLLSPGFQLLIATVIQLGIGARFYKRAWQALIRRTINSDILVAFCSSAAYLISIYFGFFSMVIVPTENLLFALSSLGIVWALLGECVEFFAQGNTYRAVRKLAPPSPDTIRILKDGKEMGIPMEQANSGDIAIVHPDEQIPMDGVIVDGIGCVDESMLTGESLPVNKKTGDTVKKASVNKLGTFRYCVRPPTAPPLAPENDTGLRYTLPKSLDKLVALLAPSALFATILIFFIRWASTHSLALAVMDAVTVLSVAWPCTLCLTIPFAILATAKKGTQIGLLVTNTHALEDIGQVTAIVFDKTGTLTKGQPSVTSMTPLGNYSEEEALRLAGVAASQYQHPLGQAVHRYAVAQLGPLPSPQRSSPQTTKGVWSLIEGRDVLLGNKELLVDHLIEITSLNALFERMETEGMAPMILAVDGKLAALLAIADTVKDTAADAVAKLQAMGIEAVMATGDNTQTAHAIAKHLGIETVFAELSPEQKLLEIARLKEQGHTVAMVGDGINDTLALAEADIGIGSKGRADVSVAADLLMPRGDLLMVPTTIRFSYKVMEKVRQNILLSFLFTALCIFLATMGFLNSSRAVVSILLAAIVIMVNSFALKPPLLS